MPKKLLKIFAFAIGFLVAAPAAFAQTTTYYFSPNFEKEISEGQTTITKYYPLPGGVIAMRRGNELFYLHADHLTSTRLVTSDEGKVMSQFDYYPYGQFVNSQPAIRNSKIEKLYTSQILDNSTDLYFYNARQYNPKTASFISADQAQGPNRYAYVGGNPINKNDPSGNVVEVGAGGGSSISTMRVPIGHYDGGLTEWGWVAATEDPKYYYHLTLGTGYQEGMGPMPPDIESLEEIAKIQAASRAWKGAFGHGTMTTRNISKCL